MNRKDYLKMINWLFPENEMDKYPARILIKGRLKNNYNFHNKRVVKKLCLSKLYALIGIENRYNKTYKVKG